MQVLAKKSAPRRQAGEPPPPASSFTVPAPVRGWILNENLATVQPGGARRLENWLTL